MALVTIPDCTAHHLLGDEQIHLASAADLSLVAVYGSIDTPALTLTLGESIAFPLDAQTTIGTQSGNGQVYLLRPHLQDIEGPQGWIKIQLPQSVEESDSHLGKLRDQFEKLLVQHGFLYDGDIRAAGDELANGLKEGGTIVADKISEAVESFKTTHSPTDAPLSFSRNTHSRAVGVSNISGTAADYARQAAEFIGGLSHTAGATIAKTLGVGQRPEEEKSEVRKTLEATGHAAGEVGAGMTESLSSVITSASIGASQVIEHSKGQEAATLAGHAGSTTSNIGQVAGAGILGTSATFHGAQAARGMVDVDLHPSRTLAKEEEEEKGAVEQATD